MRYFLLLAVALSLTLSWQASATACALSTCHASCDSRSNH